LEQRGITLATRAPADISETATRQFLLQAAELETWTPDYLRQVFGLDAPGAKQALAVLQAAGYVEPVGGRRNQRRNNAAGNAVAGVSGPGDADLRASRGRRTRAGASRGLYGAGVGPACV
jgi:hypothetical protein